MQHRIRAALVALLAFSVLALPGCGSEQEESAEQVAASPPPAGASTVAQDQATAVADGGASDAEQEAEQQPSAGGAQKEGKDGAAKAAPTPIKTVRLAGRKTIEARTAKFTMFMNFSGFAPAGTEGPDGFGFRIDGAADFDRNVSKFTMYMPYAGQMKVRQIGSDVYLRMPEYMRERLPYSEPWIRWTVDDGTQGSASGGASQAQSGTPDDVTGGLDYLREVSNGVEEVGKDYVRGVATTRYRAEINLERVSDGSSPKLRESFREAREVLGIDTLPVEAWIDDEGRIRRFTMEISPDSPELREAGIDDAQITITQEIYDYGAPVRVEAPPEEDTVDAEEIQDRGRQNVA